MIVGHSLKRLIVTGEPRPEVKWSKDGELVQQGDRVKVHDDAVSSISELNISDAKVEDSGMYCAEAVNVLGTVQTTAVVRVMENVRSEEHLETLVVASTTKTVEELYQEDTEEVSVREDTVVVTEKKERTETEETLETREEMHEIVAETVEVVTDGAPLRQQTSVTEVEKLDKAEEVERTEVISTRRSVTDYAEVAKNQQEDAAVKPKEISAPEDNVQSPVFAVRPQSLELAGQETIVTISGDETLEIAETSSATETKTISRDVVEEKSEERIKLEHEVREVAVSDSLVEDDNKEKNESQGRQDIRETSQTLEQVSDVESQVILEAKDSTLITAVEETEVTKEEKVVESSKKELEGPLPVFKIKPVSTTVHEGEVLLLACVVAEQPQVEITWSKDGKKLETTGRDARIRTIDDKLGGAYLLEIAETTTEDIGEYTLSAESEGGVVSCTVSVSVIAKLEPEVPLSTVTEQTSLTAALSQARESNVDAEGTLALQEKEPLQSVVSKTDVEEIGRQEESVVVTRIPAATADHTVVGLGEPLEDHEVSAVEEKLIESSEEVRKAESETSSSAETVSETSEAAGVRTLISKETIIKKTKKSKDKQEKASSEILEENETVEEVEEKTSEEVTVEDMSQKEVAEEMVVERSKVDDKTVTENVTIVEDAAMKNVVAAEVEEIDVEYSEEEFEGPLPVIEVKPVPTAVIASETVRLVCKVAEEPAAQIHWSKNGQRLEATSENRKINMVVDVETGMHYLEIVEASLEDIGEYTLTAESEGGIVSCTVSVDVVSELEVSSTLKQTSQAVSVPENVQQFKPLEQTATDSEVAESTEPLGTVETGEVVVDKISELPRASEAAPVFVSVPQPVHVDEGSAVHLQCRVEGQI